MSFEGKPPLVNQAPIFDGSKFLHQVVAIPSLRKTASDGFTFLRWALDEATGSTSFANTGSAVAGNCNVVAGTLRAGRTSILNNASGRGSFDSGLGAYIRTGTQGVAMNPSATVFSTHGWIKQRAIPANGRILTKWFSSDGVTPSAAPDAWGLLTQAPTGNLYVQTNNGGVNKGTTPFGTRDLIRQNDWVHIAATFNAGTVKIYVNGSLAQTDATFPASINFNGASGGSWSIGGSPVGFDFDGDCSDWVVDSGVERSDAYFKALVNLAWNR